MQLCFLFLYTMFCLPCFLWCHFHCCALALNCCCHLRTTSLYFPDCVASEIERKLYQWLVVASWRRFTVSHAFSSIVATNWAWPGYSIFEKVLTVLLYVLFLDNLLNMLFTCLHRVGLVSIGCMVFGACVCAVLM